MKGRKMPNFPNFDSYPGQTDSFNANLDIFFAHQFVSEETPQILSKKVWNKQLYITWSIEHTPILPGTITGLVQLEDEVIQTFVIDESGIANVVDTNKRGHIFVKNMSVNVTNGELETIWNSDHINDVFPHISLSYEYNLHVDTHVETKTFKKVKDLKSSETLLVEVYKELRNYDTLAAMHLLEDAILQLGVEVDEL